METQVNPEAQVILTEDTFSLVKTPTPNEWGIVAGQYRKPQDKKIEGLGPDWGNARFIKKAGWYNKCGRYVGSGDLSLADIDKLVSEILENDEIFIALSNKDSFRNFVRGSKEYHGAFHKGNGLYAEMPPWQEPGFDYLADRCILLLAKNQICLAEDKLHKVWPKVLGVSILRETRMRRDEIRHALKMLAHFQR